MPCVSLQLQLLPLELLTVTASEIGFPGDPSWNGPICLILRWRSVYNIDCVMVGGKPADKAQQLLQQ